MVPSPQRPRRSPFWVLWAFIAGVVAVFVSVSFVQEVRRRVLLEQHIRNLHQEIQARERRIADLKKLSEYLRTDAYLERAAREKLNYQRPGERVVVVPEADRPGRDAAAASRGAGAQDRHSPARQWWRLFFPP